MESRTGPGRELGGDTRIAGRCGGGADPSRAAVTSAGTLSAPGLPQRRRRLPRLRTVPGHGGGSRGARSGRDDPGGQRVPRAARHVPQLVLLGIRRHHPAPPARTGTDRIRSGRPRPYRQRRVDPRSRTETDTPAAAVGLLHLLDDRARRIHDRVPGRGPFAHRRCGTTYLVLRPGLLVREARLGADPAHTAAGELYAVLCPGAGCLGPAHPRLAGGRYLAAAAPRQRR